MKLAEALILRADCQKRLAQLKERLLRAAKVQEGDAPPEDPTALLEEVSRLTQELQQLIQRINRTNNSAAFPDGGTLADALARRDVLKLHRAILVDLATAAVVQQDRYSKSEVRFRSTVDVAATQKRADALAKEYRELDARIQETNWKTDLLEG